MLMGLEERAANEALRVQSSLQKGDGWPDLSDVFKLLEEFAFQTGHKGLFRQAIEMPVPLDPNFIQHTQTP